MVPTRYQQVLLKSIKNFYGRQATSENYHLKAKSFKKLCSVLNTDHEKQ